MQSAAPLTHDLVLVGGGHTHALVLRMLAMKPVPGVRLTLISPTPTAAYSGMLPGHIAGHYDRAALDIDLVHLARFAGARLILDFATGIDPQRGEIHLAGRGPVGYDLASFDVGIHAQMPDLPGFAQHGIAAKPLDLFADRWRDFIASDAPREIAVLGGGLAGVELALAMAHREPKAAVALIEREAGLNGISPRIAAALKRELARARVSCHFNAEAIAITDREVQLADGRKVPSRFTLGAAGARPWEWLAQSGLPCEDGFLRTLPTLQIEGHPTLFAAGDCAHLIESPRPKAGVYAVRAAPVLLANLHAAVAGRPLRPFRPQKGYLKLISLGGKRALADRGRWRLTAPAGLLWRWKNRIDQRFMERFRALPAMGAEGEDQALCGACGAKLGPEALKGALAALPQPKRTDVLTGPGDDAAVLAMGDTRQVLTTDHLRAFWADPWLAARITAVHALGDVWSMGAAPQAALAALTLDRMSPALQARTLTEIMEAAGAVFAEAGAEIVGGHSTMGAEMSLGFTVTGLAPDVTLQSGARPGDALVLTRPLGSGTLLAAFMQGKGAGADVAKMLGEMARPQGSAAAALTQAHAMTDVTGFGLAGHLGAICRASGVGAEIDLEALPLYAGVEALAEAGIRSTIWPENRLAAPVVGATGARGALLHDPQTAGGLLAALAPEDLVAASTALRAAGHCTAVIGTVTAAPGLRVQGA